METKLYVKEGVGFQGFHTARRKSNRKGLLIVASLILLLTLGSFASRFLGKATPETAVVPSPTPVVETPTPVASASPTIKISVMPSPTIKLSPTKAADPKSAIKVEILNGSGKAGVALQTAKTVESFGYTVTRTGNADKFTYTGLTILTKNATTLNLLKKDLSKDYTISSAAASLSSSATVDARIIIGK